VLRCSPDIGRELRTCEMAEDKEVDRKQERMKEENHVKEVDQTPKTMIIEGSRKEDRMDGVKHDTDTVKSINNVKVQRATAGNKSRWMCLVIRRLNIGHPWPRVCSILRNCRSTTMPVYWPAARHGTTLKWSSPPSGICGWDGIGLGCSVKQADGLEG